MAQDDTKKFPMATALTIVTGWHLEPNKMNVIELAEHMTGCSMRPPVEPKAHAYIVEEFENAARICQPALLAQHDYLKSAAQRFEKTCGPRLETATPPDRSRIIQEWLKKEAAHTPAEFRDGIPIKKLPAGSYEPERPLVILFLGAPVQTPLDKKHLH